MKTAMTSGSLSKRRRPEEDLGRNATIPIPAEAVVMTIFG
jgi:hypothetical protein